MPRPERRPRLPWLVGGPLHGQPVTHDDDPPSRRVLYADPVELDGAGPPGRSTPIPTTLYQRDPYAFGFADGTSVSFDVWHAGKTDAETDRLTVELVLERAGITYRRTTPDPAGAPGATTSANVAPPTTTQEDTQHA